MTPLPPIQPRYTSADELLDVTRSFVAEHVEPMAGPWQSERHMGIEALEQAGRLGLLGIQLPVELGGSSLPYSAKLRAGAMIAAADFGFAMSWINTQGVAMTIARWLPREVALRWVPDLIAARRFGSTCLTEPGAGSDFSAIQMRAERSGDDWVLNGQKAWIINAQRSEVLVVYAQTEPGAGARGIAGFVVDANRSGFVRTEPGRTEMVASMGTGGFRLEGYRARADELMHPPGLAFKRALESINQARTYVAAMAISMTRRCLQVAADYGRGRETFGQRLADHPAWRVSLIDTLIDLSAADTLLERACVIADAAGPLDLAAAQLKSFATSMAVRHIAALQHAMGAAGLAECFPFTRHLAAAQAATLVDGSTEMLRERLWASFQRSASGL